MTILQQWMKLITLSYIRYDKSDGNFEIESFCFALFDFLIKFVFDSKLDNEVTSLVDFTPELLVHCVSKCLHLIQPDLEVPESLPPG